jgi:acyl-CoA reductase-like NAD-dependent aldehyde dehydrogenase
MKLPTDLPVQVAAGPTTVNPFIGGRVEESSSDRVVEVIDPSTGRKCLSLPIGSQGDVDRAVASCREAFDDGRWRQAPPSFRKKILYRFAELIAREAGALDALDAGEMGKPVGEAFGNASGAADFTRFYAEAVDKVAGDVYTSDGTNFVVQRRLPRGVVAAVVPWNFPTYNAVFKIAPALAAGNCVVLKPSELSSRSAAHLAQLALEAGIPPGVLNLVPGLGETVGRALGLHDGVDMIAFTGSTEVGKRMLQYAGQSNMKSVMTECGGKSPHIVFGDGVDLEAVSQRIVRSMLTNQGQICTMGSRLLVQREIEDELIGKITDKLSNLVVGNAMDPTTTFGPLATNKQCTRVMEYIESAQSEGAQLIAGGRRTLMESGGYFVEPTVFRTVSSKIRIAQEEIFGPVLSVIPFQDEAEAVRVANGTIYGLVAYVWTTTLSRGMRMARDIRSSLFINAAASVGEGPGHAAGSEPVGQSGLGAEGGLAGMETYMRRQLVWFSHA